MASSIYNQIREIAADLNAEVIETEEIVVTFSPVRLNIRAGMTDEEITLMLDDIYPLGDRPWSAWDRVED